MDEDREKRLRERLTAPRPPALERARTFLRYYVHDSDPELLERDVRSMIKVNPRTIVDALEAFDELLTTPQPQGSLSEIVAYEGNQMLDDESDVAAIAWIARLAEQLRRWLRAYAPE